MELKLKKGILNKLYNGTYSQPEKSKLDTYFNMYNLHLQTINETVINYGMCSFIIIDIL